MNRLEFEEEVLRSLDGMETLRADRYMRNSAGELLSTAEDGTRYIVKEWFADPECDLKDERSLVSGAGPGAFAPAVSAGSSGRRRGTGDP